MQTCKLKYTYLDEDTFWLGILAAAEFENLSANNRLKGYCTGQLLFVCDIILPIKHMVNW